MLGDQRTNLMGGVALERLVGDFSRQRQVELANDRAGKRDHAGWDRNAPEAEPERDS